VLWEVLPAGKQKAIEVSVPARTRSRGAGIVVHRRAALDGRGIVQCHQIPVTTPISTLIDIATQLGRSQLEAAINEADKRDLVGPEELRSALDEVARIPGVGVLRKLLDRQTFALTDSELDRRFLSIAREVGLARPETGKWLNGFKVDFYWPDLGLVVETDGLRYHRTAAQQARDRIRDQAHARAGLTQLRFTHAQVNFEPGYVRATLGAVARRLMRA
jgi:very-short-patch-repair endonuclease